MPHYGSPRGIVGTAVGIGGSVGNPGVLVGAGVGGTETDCNGAHVAGAVCAGGAVGGGTEAVGAGVAVVEALAPGVAAGPGTICGAAESMNDGAGGEAG